MAIRIRKRPGYVRWAAADSFQPMSLAQYVIDQINNGTILPGGYGGGSWSVPTPGDPGTGSTGSLMDSLIIHDSDSIAGLGLLLSTNLNTDIPHWDPIDDGLEFPRLIDDIALTPGGNLYVANLVGGDDTLIARAATVGDSFVTVMNKAVLDDLYGPGTTGSHHINFIAAHPTLADEIIFIAYNSMGGDFFRSSAGDIEVVDALHGFLGGGGELFRPSFGAGLWLSGIGNDSGDIVTFPQDYSSYAGIDANIGIGNNFHARVGQTDKTYHIINDATTLKLGSGNYSSHVDIVTAGIPLDFLADTARRANYKFVVDSTGMIILARGNAEGTHVAVRSIDGGANFLAISDLPNDFNLFQKAINSDDQWVCTNGGNVFVSSDGGETWDDQTGDLLDQNSGADINCMQVLS